MQRRPHAGGHSPFCLWGYNQPVLCHCKVPGPSIFGFVPGAITSCIMLQHSNHGPHPLCTTSHVHIPCLICRCVQEAFSYTSLSSISLKTAASNALPSCGAARFACGVHLSPSGAALPPSLLESRYVLIHLLQLVREEGEAASERDRYTPEAKQAAPQEGMLLLKRHSVATVVAPEVMRTKHSKTTAFCVCTIYHT